MQPRAIYKVVVNGVDYTTRFDPVLKSIEVHDGDGKKSDRASITVADPMGQTYMPEPDASVQISLGHEGQGVGLVFRGKVATCRSSGSKGGGRELKISAKGLDGKSKAKEPAERTAENKSFGDIAQQWGRAAGLSAVRIAPSLRSIQREWWGMQNESFLHWGERMANELGATLRISNNEAIFVEMGAGQSASGKTLPTVVADASETGNMISWDIDPYSARAQHTQVRVRSYDRNTASFREESVDVEDTDAPARARRTTTSGTRTSARQAAQGNRKKAKRKKGGGTITVLGNSHARPEGTVTVMNTREGVDGDYKITSVSHSYSKSGGFTTKLSFGDSKAGKDKRRRRGRSR